MLNTLIQLPKGELLDPWDPNNWTNDDHEHRIYGTADLSVYVVVDAIDYPYLSRFKWCVHDRRKLNHIYLHRSISKFYESDGERYVSEFTGKLVRNRKRIQYNEFIHQAIMRRTGVPQPTPAHKEVDHLDRDLQNCRRVNLQWATRGMQNANRRAYHEYRMP